MTCLLPRIALTLAGLAAMASANAQIEMYQDDNFGGRMFGSRNSVANLDGAGFNDKASSVIVRGGNWQICSDAFFRGSCVVLRPGNYPSLRPMGMNDKVSSARSLGWTPDGNGGWNNNNNNNNSGGGGGNSYGDNGPNSNNSGYGSWENPNSNPGGSNGSYGHNQPWGNGGGNWGSGTRAVLYQDANLSGRAVPVNPSGILNLSDIGFNDRASSLRIEAGYWLFCSDANYRGECRTFGPGDYPSLPNGMNDRISSGRRLSGNYPYQQNPNWGH